MSSENPSWKLCVFRVKVANLGELTAVVLRIVSGTRWKMPQRDREGFDWDKQLDQRFIILGS